MIRIRDISLSPGQDQAKLHQLCAKVLKLSPADISYLEIHKR